MPALVTIQYNTMRTVVYAPVTETYHEAAGNRSPYALLSSSALNQLQNNTKSVISCKLEKHFRSPCQRRQSCVIDTVQPFLMHNLHTIWRLISALPPNMCHPSKSVNQMTKDDVLATVPFLLSMPACPSKSGDCIVSDIVVFVLKRDVKLQLTN